MQRNNNSKVEYKEGINLLDAGSSDEEQEHFSIPPALRLNIHEEGRRKKKHCCSWHICVLSFGLLFVLTAIFALGLYTYDLKRQLEEVRQKAFSLLCDFVLKRNKRQRSSSAC
ncbi:hypothetical protein CAPTEDRAFT_185263 [Capitella teleta]|uniref:Uncharacterized protein n=1 Tax=Capitella teleta TaxID=283909 RepID=R7TAA5_CAPTE|nr:hypothetical protein CAPTEDRAFT_185263 [Capitella teleta]|eukprot:ELT88320.1 hypothetical protein CAPTEDRAFT_185263 [Capitella teleta]